MPLNLEQINRLISEYFPAANKKLNILEVGAEGAILTFKIDEKALRPGGTVSGPTIMMIADLALYIAILGRIETSIRAVTTNLSFNFFHRASGDHDLLAKCRLLKVGKTLVTGEVLIYSLADPEQPIAHAVGTFAL